jgi:hypothetical protein
MIPFLIDDCVFQLRRTSTRVREVSSAHPYPDNAQLKEAISIPNAQDLVVEFDERCHLKEGHAILSFFSDQECTNEIAVMSGSGFCPPQDQSGCGFRTLLIRGNRYRT